MAQVVIEHLSKIFAGPKGEHIEAVNDLSLATEDKEFLVLLGPSGSGKTTILRLIAGLEEPTSGTISVDGKDFRGVPPQHRGVAMLFQNPALYPHMTTYENLAFGLKLRRCPKAQLDERVLSAAEMLGIKDCLGRKPEALSGGQRQRVALARAIVQQPAVLLLDEPLSNLDPPLRLQMRTELRRLHGRLACTMICVTHDQTEAMTMGHRIAVIKEGSIEQIADPITVYDRPQNTFVASFIGSPPMNFLSGAFAQKDGALYFIEQTGDLAAPASPPAFALKLPGTLADRLQSFAGKPLILGIRPENISLGAAGNGAEFEARIEMIEPLGWEAHLQLIRRDRLFTARISATDQLRSNQTVSFSIQMEKAHFFDPATQKAII